MNDIVKKKTLFLDLTLEALTEKLANDNHPKFASHQIYDWVYRKRQFLDSSLWTNVSKKVKAYLAEGYAFSLPRIVYKSISTDGTVKFLLALHDNEQIETVLIPAKGRLTLCVSSQVGCGLKCSFCHTGTQGLTRNLEAGEIVGQYLAAQAWLDEYLEFNEEYPEKKISNIVFMGQGEPLQNFNNVKKSIEIFMEPKGLAIGQRRITLSTSGVVPQIKKLADFPPVNIAISLHSPSNSVRSELMPINNAYNIQTLLGALKDLPLKKHRKITYEYLLIENLTDRYEDANALAKLLPKADSKINLIPFNEYPGGQYKRPSNERILKFMDLLIKKGLVCTIRASKGRDILAACGQLKSKTLAKQAKATVA